MSQSREIRKIVSGDTVTADVLRSFLMSILHHDALRDELLELVLGGIRGGWVDAGTLAGNLPRLVSEVLNAAEPEDWETVAALLIEDARDLLREEGEL